MRFGSFLLPLLVASGLCASTGAAHATLITIVFSGTIDSFEDPGGATDGSIAPGVPFTGTATWDDAATDLAPGDPTHGNYRNFAPPWNLVVHVGSYSFGPGAFRVVATVSDRQSGNPDPDVFRVANEGAVQPTPSSFSVGVSFSLESAGNALLTSDALTGVPLSLAAWDFARVDAFIFTHDGSLGSFGGPVDQLAVPEPATATVLSLGLALLRARRLSLQPRRG